jgi:hypothetical protein
MAAGKRPASLNIQCIVAGAASQHPNGLLTKAGRGTRRLDPVSDPGYSSRISLHHRTLLVTLVWSAPRLLLRTHERHSTADLCGCVLWRCSRGLEQVVAWDGRVGGETAAQVEGGANVAGP